MPSKDKWARLEAVRKAERSKRNRLITLYGGKCAICGNENRNVLQLDHIHGDGCRERDILGNTKAVYTNALNTFRPDRYRILCANCNMEQRIINGHQGGRHGRFNPEELLGLGFGPLFDGDPEDAA